MNRAEHKRRERDVGHQRGLTCLEEAIYHGVGWREGPDPAVRVPARTELSHQVFHQPSSLRDLKDVGEGAQFVLARLGLAIEQRGDPDLVLVHRLGYLFERQAGIRFSIEKLGECIAWIGFSERIVSHGRTRLQRCREKDMGPYIYITPTLTRPHIE